MDSVRLLKRESNKLFNLGMHLNNDKTMLSTIYATFSRLGNKAVIQKPHFNNIQLIGLVNIVTRVLENGGTILVINTEDSRAPQYQELFEGLNIICWEDP